MQFALFPDTPEMHWSILNSTVSLLTAVSSWLKEPSALPRVITLSCDSDGLR